MLRDTDWAVEVDKESSMSIVLRSDHELRLLQHVYNMVHSYGTKYRSVKCGTDVYATEGGVPRYKYCTIVRWLVEVYIYIY